MYCYCCYYFYYFLFFFQLNYHQIWNGRNGKIPKDLVFETKLPGLLSLSQWRKEVWGAKLKPTSSTQYISGGSSDIKYLGYLGIIIQSSYHKEIPGATTLTFFLPHIIGGMNLSDMCRLGRASFIIFHFSCGNWVMIAWIYHKMPTLIFWKFKKLVKILFWSPDIGPYLPLTIDICCLVVVVVIIIIWYLFDDEALWPRIFGETYEIEP